MTVEPTARYMLKLVADRRGWTIHKDIAGDCSDTFVRGDDRIVVHYDEVYQSVIWAEQHYGDKTTLTKKSRRKKEHVRNWMQEPVKQGQEYPDRPPTAPATSHAAKAMSAFDKAFSHAAVAEEKPTTDGQSHKRAVVRGLPRPDGSYPLSAILLTGEHIGQKITVKNPKNGIVYTAYLIHIKHLEGLWNTSISEAAPNIMSVRLRGTRRDINFAEDPFEIGLYDLVTLYGPEDQEL